MLAVNYINLLTKLYPELPKVYNLETAAYFYGATVANVSVATFFYPKDCDFTPSNYLIGIEVDTLKDIPKRIVGSFYLTSPERTLVDLYLYEELVDPQVTFDYISWFAVEFNEDPALYLPEQYRHGAREIVKEGWSHGNK